MKRTALEDLQFDGLVRPGDTVVWGQGCGEPQSLVERLLQQRHSIGRFRVFLGTTFSSTVTPEHADVVEFVGLGGTGAARRLSAANALDVTPIHMSQLDALIDRRVLRVDVVLIQVARSDRSDEYSLGLTSDYVRTAARRARVVVAELNDQVPRTVCEEPLREDEIDLIVETSRPLIEVQRAAPGDVEGRLAANIAPFIPERATLQVGLGAIPEAVLAVLSDRRGLGVHSAVIGDRVAELMEAGAITNEYKEIDRGITTTCLLIGTRRLYHFADGDPRVLMVPVSRTHGPRSLSQLRRFVAVNSALEVDLTGQVNAEAIGREYVGLVGGQVDYLRAAATSEDGCGIVALPSTAGRASRIVARLSGPVTTARSDVGVVATEYGAADLRGRSVRERVRAMIALAHPEHRAALEREARELYR